MMKKFFLSIVILNALIFISSCTQQASNSAKELPEIPVTIGQVQFDDNGKFLSASGKIEAVNSAQISTRIMGYVTSIKAEVGQKVKKGQLLATINSTDLLAKKAQAEAGIAQANAAFINAKKDYDRFKVLFSQKSATQKELDDMATRFEMAKAGLDAAKQIKNEVVSQFSYSNITAPFSGVITSTFVKQGDMANPGMPLLSLEGQSSVQAVVMIPESEISLITQGMSAQVTVKSINKKLKGRIAEISPSAFNTGGQFLVKIELDSQEVTVLPGMFVSAMFETKSKSVKNQNEDILIPEEAIIEQGQLKGLFVLSDSNIALLRWLRTGKTFGNQVEVLSGLKPGEKYVLKADGRLYNGAKVKVK
ncbi:MAG: efflux RND transporter periplasmic adaptor subunit [Ferruginibacter sp.]|nr:efflux RND transporter periplasmic adaptor subunit [Ferruginibacter sp.]